AAARTLRRKTIRLGRDQLSAWRVVHGGRVYDFADLLEGNLDADLARRDFTVNAMAVELETGHFLDPHGGQRDAGDRIVRMVRAENFDDDPLRTLKAVRMAVRYSMELDPGTLASIRPRASRILEVAPERVTYELSIILASDAFRRSVSLLHETGLDVPLFGRSLDATAFHSDDVPLAAAMAVLVEDPVAHAKRWRWSESLLRQTQSLERLALMAGDLRIPLYDAGPEVASQLPPMLRALGRSDEIPMPDFRIRALLSGEEIAAITGLLAGRELGALKRMLLEAQIRGEVSTRDEAEAFVWESTKSEE
ncbi:MAG: hypothetical protein WA208_17680, partial [Thermoanaerobaculia bacterium]